MTQQREPEIEFTKERAANFSKWFTDAIIDFQSRTREWLPSASAVADRIGVAASTVLAWRNGASLPRRDQCIKIAEAFGVNVSDVLAAAGHPLAREDRAVTYAELISIIEQDAHLPPDRRAAITDALRDAMSPQFGESAWKRSADALLRSGQPYVERGERIAQIVELWRKEVQKQRNQTA